MNVRISYGVDIDQVPSKIAEMLDRCELEVVKLLENLRLYSKLLGHDGAFCEPVLGGLEAARQQLTNIDSKVMEAGMILKGFVDAKKEVGQQSPTGVPAPENTGNVNAD